MVPQMLAPGLIYCNGLVSEYIEPVNCPGYIIINSYFKEEGKVSYKIEAYCTKITRTVECRFQVL